MMRHEERGDPSSGRPPSQRCFACAACPGLDIPVADARCGLLAPGQAGFLQAGVGVLIAAGRAGKEDIVLPELGWQSAAAAGLGDDVLGFEVSRIHTGAAFFIARPSL